MRIILLRHSNRTYSVNTRFNQGILFYTSLLLLCFLTDEHPSQVEVRAVLINCEHEWKDTGSDNAATRFEREELFKHSDLRECNKKLALTVKLDSESLESGDEFISVDHVTEGRGRGRLRLLNPYVLRLRRHPAMQAYTIRRTDTVVGILTQKDDLSEFAKMETQQAMSQNFDRTLSRQERSVLSDIQAMNVDSNSVSPIQDFRNDIFINGTKSSEPLPHPGKDHHNAMSKLRHQFSKWQMPSFRPPGNQGKQGITNGTKPYKIIIPLDRNKRHEFNVVVEDPGNLDKNENKEGNDVDRSMYDESGEKLYTIKQTPEETDENAPNSREDPYKNREVFDNGKPYEPIMDVQADDIKDFGHAMPKKNKQKATDELEEEFALYDVGDPEIWCTLNIQLFEKMTSPEGKTVWNDYTAGEAVSVGSFGSEWIGDDLTVRYRPTDLVDRNQFDLPNTSLRLLVPLSDSTQMPSPEGRESPVNDYIVVPSEDIVYLDEKLKDRINNNWNLNYKGSTTEDNSTNHPRRVIVRVGRVERAAAGGKFSISRRGTRRYLTLLHKKPHHVQLDLEARADDNQLVRVGASGRISTVVTDSTWRNSRSVLTSQITNTGLAAARFRIVVRDCEGSPTEESGGDEMCATPPELVPPYHTRQLRLEVPIDLPSNARHCSVAMVNDNDETVAVRDVTLKKADRCFCVWHCECVCLGDDPTLACIEMRESRAAAAGLQANAHPRRARVCCDCDTCIDWLAILVGLLMAMLLLGILKAFIGLVFRRIGMWGLWWLVKLPRPLHKGYYESKLRRRDVVYDRDGWPIHPDTSEHTVRVISLALEMFLNSIFFFVIPWVVMFDAIRRLSKHFKKPKREKTYTATSQMAIAQRHTVNAQSVTLGPAHGEQDGQPHWMSPHAQEISTDLWRNALCLHSNACQQRPVRQKRRTGRRAQVPSHTCMMDDCSCQDSDECETDYVLKEMQNSRQSLGKHHSRNLVQSSSQSVSMKHPKLQHRRRHSSTQSFEKCPCSSDNAPCLLSRQHFK